MTESRRPGDRNPRTDAERRVVHGDEGKATLSEKAVLIGYRGDLVDKAPTVGGDIDGYGEERPIAKKA